MELDLCLLGVYHPAVRQPLDHKFSTVGLSVSSRPDLAASRGPPGRLVERMTLCDAECSR